MLAQRLDGVVAAARLEPAMARRSPALKRQLVGTHRARQHGGGGRHDGRAAWRARGADRRSGRRTGGRACCRDRSARGRRRRPAWSRSHSRAASFSRRRVRLRTTALPTFLVTVNPTRAARHRRAAAPAAPGHARRLAALRGHTQKFRPALQAFRRQRTALPRGAICRAPGRSGRQALAALGAAVGEHLAAADRRHPGAEAMPPLADQLRRLIGALHGNSPSPQMKASRPSMIGGRDKTRADGGRTGTRRRPRLIEAAAPRRQPAPAKPPRPGSRGLEP